MDSEFLQAPIRPHKGPMKSKYFCLDKEKQWLNGWLTYAASAMHIYLLSLNHTKVWIIKCKAEVCVTPDKEGTPQARARAANIGVNEPGYAVNKGWLMTSLRQPCDCVMALLLINQLSNLLCQPSLALISNTYLYVPGISGFWFL